MTKQIKLSELKADINAGMKREALRVKYTDGNNNQLNVILKQAGLKIRSFKVNPLKPKFELIDDTIEDSTTRFEQAYKQMEYLITLPQADVLAQIREIVEHNKRIMFETDWQQQFHSDLKTALTI